MKNKAYYWYRPHCYFEGFYPGKVLNLMSDNKTFFKYLPDITDYMLAKKYFPNGLSPHGFSMLLFQELSASNVIEPITEIVFELVRQLHYPNAVSRLTSLYATESMEQAEQWRQLWIDNFGDKHRCIAQSLWEIEFEADAKLYDATWLNTAPDQKSGFSYIHALENAHKYWQGELSKCPLPELLVPFPVVVSRMVRGHIVPK